MKAIRWVRGNGKVVALVVFTALAIVWMVLAAYDVPVQGDRWQAQ